MFFLQDGVSFEEFNQMFENRQREKVISHENELWYMLCLALVENRDKIEKQAFELAKKYGLLGALKLQHTTDNTPCYGCGSQTENKIPLCDTCKKDIWPE